jgi:plastocyanin
LSHRRKAAIAVVIAVLVVPASASAATRVVDMGPPGNAEKALGKLGGTANAFFPATTTIHTGDSVRFVPLGFHNLDIPKKGGAATETFLPTGQTIAGANDAAGAAFWFNGQPGIGFNRALAVNGFGKKFTYSGAKGIQSGLPASEKVKPLTVKFTKAGTVTYYCDLHAGMKARVRVLGKSKRVPSAKAHAKLINDQANRAVTTGKKVAKTAPPANTVSLGVAGGGGVELLAMVPAATTVPVGTTVTFSMPAASREAHTGTFGPGNIEDPASFIGKLASGFESGQLDPSAVYPSDPPGTVASLSPTLHGNGFWNSGVLDASAASPLPLASQVKFTAPGAYTYYCLIHPFMKGTVTVQ